MVMLLRIVEVKIVVSEVCVMSAVSVIWVKVNSVVARFVLDIGSLEDETVWVIVPVETSEGLEVSTMMLVAYSVVSLSTRVPLVAMACDVDLERGRLDSGVVVDVAITTADVANVDVPTTFVLS